MNKNKIKIGTTEFELGTYLTIGRSGKGSSFINSWTNIIINSIINEIIKNKKTHDITIEEIKNYLSIDKIEKLIPIEHLENWNNGGEDSKAAIIGVINLAIKE